MTTEIRRVVCAAIRSSSGLLITGARHYDRGMCEQITKRIDGQQFVSRPDEHQGFIDQHGAWMNRFEAYDVALAAGQIVYPQRCGTGLDADGNARPKLYSEGLY